MFLCLLRVLNTNWFQQGCLAADMGRGRSICPCARIILARAYTTHGNLLPPTLPTHPPSAPLQLNKLKIHEIQILLLSFKVPPRCRGVHDLLTASLHLPILITLCGFSTKKPSDQILPLCQPQNRSSLNVLTAVRLSTSSIHMKGERCEGNVSIHKLQPSSQ